LSLSGFVVKFKCYSTFMKLRILKYFLLLLLLVLFISCGGGEQSGTPSAGTSASTSSSTSLLKGSNTFDLDDESMTIPPKKDGSTDDPWTGTDPWNPWPEDDPNWPWSRPLAGQKVDPETAIPLVRLNICAMTREYGDFSRVDWEDTYTPSTHLDGLFINLKFDYLPPHYFKRWAQLGWSDLIPFIINANIQHSNDLVLSESLLEQWFRGPLNPFPFISGYNFTNRPLQTQDILSVFDQPTSNYRHARTYVFDDNRSPAASISPGDLVQSGSDMTHLDTGYRFEQRVWSNAADRDYGMRRADGSRNAEGRYKSLAGPDPKILELQLSIPILYDQGNWHYFRIKGFDIPVHRAVIQNQALHQSYKDEQFNPLGGCYEGLPPQISADVVHNFNPLDSSTGWWSRDHWVVPEY